MLQPVRLLVVSTIVLVGVASIAPSSAFGQNGSRRARRNAMLANRAGASGTGYYPVANRGTPANPADSQAVYQAYRLLSQADHDYQGHRAKAMEHLRKAGRTLGISLKGDGKSQEQQGTSDSQLKQAQTTLQTMTKNGVNSRRHQRAMTHVNSALAEIETALSVK
jgi:hypothetical protein